MFQMTSVQVAIAIFGYLERGTLSFCTQLQIHNVIKISPLFLESFINNVIRCGVENQNNAIRSDTAKLQTLSTYQSFSVLISDSLAPTQPSSIRKIPRPTSPIIKP